MRLKNGKPLLDGLSPSWHRSKYRLMSLRDMPVPFEAANHPKLVHIVIRIYPDAFLRLLRAKDALLLIIPKRVRLQVEPLGNLEIRYPGLTMLCSSFRIVFLSSSVKGFSWLVNRQTTK